MKGISEEQLEQLMNAIRGGSDIDTACNFAGASTTIVYRALERGAIENDLNGQDLTGGEQEQPYLTLWNELKKARADAIVRNVAHVQKAAQTNWQAAAWWLERAAPTQYGKQTERKSVSPNERPQITGE